jgi:hypothetical protein
VDCGIIFEFQCVNVNFIPMEKTATPKRYNLKLPVDPNKPKVPLIRCPECKRDNIQARSRRKYFLRSIPFLIVVLFLLFDL